MLNWSQSIWLQSSHSQWYTTWYLICGRLKINMVILFFYFFIFIFYCSGFCHTLKWISHGFTCVPHPNPSSHLPLHPIPLGLPSVPAPSACLMHPTWDTCTPMFIAALSIIARTWKQPRCPSAEEWIRKLWYIYTMEYYSAIKKNSFESILMVYLS